ncbi:DNA polymerase III subunit gamma/tau [Psychromonas marina]|uniref:DNA polymerase III subunit gamma/tau n=1 Tax=Psychromonas marina TaxID=88364 RepID=A0ABQ6E2G4_9GAMM|nr:DNA polymerase III subunit gamma/tau [Psychromonas marina]GLS91608.1 DNA polymerase III subunit gamma/tau [Psychromonas marina]
MSYQVLARKWRPHNFSEVVGQQHVLTAISNGLAQNKVHHAYLFSGTRGVGKTTIARILAKSLNCELGVTATPCGQCDNCVAIDQGRFVDLLEIDAASRTKVDDTREMLDNVQYKPAVGRYKVYLIDEVHMLSKHSFNALLKTLEEPPEYVKFLLATTDPQKLPITVLSRCLQFHLKAILPDQIEAQLAHILQQEKATFEHAALTVIAKAADGSMRDALSLTDQALAFGAGNIEYQSVLKMLGTLDNSHLEYLLHFIASGNVAKVFQKIEEFVALGADFAKLHQELAALCHQVALQQLQPVQSNGEKSAIQLLSERLNPEEVQLYYQIAVQGYKDYNFAPNGKIALEMTVMRLLAFKPANYVELDETVLVTPAVETQPVVAPSAAEQQVAVVEHAVMPTAPVIPVIPTEALVIDSPKTAAAPSAITEPLAPRHTIEPVLEKNVGQEITAPVTAPEQPTPVTETPTTITESLSQVTHSRNMLRSHRLKRNETKKLQATTEPKINQPVVAETPNDAQSVTKNSVKPVSEEITLPTGTPSAVEPTIETAVIPTQGHATKTLPPSEDYQHNEFMDNQFDGADYDPYSAPQDYLAMQPQPIEEVSNVAPIMQPVSNGERVGQHPFFSTQPFQAVEIDTAKYVEDKLTDPWSLAIQQMKVAGLVKLLAKNSVMKKVDNQIVLTLKAEQQHLLNNGGLCEELQMQLKNYFGTQYSMYIEVGNVEGQLTAFESEMALYEQYLDNAKRAIVEDENIKALAANCGAKVYENSVIPL